MVCGQLRRRACRARGRATASPNRPVRLPDGLRWNLLHLFTEARRRRCAGRPARRRRRRHLGRRLRAARRRRRVLGLPFHYRDERTDGWSPLGASAASSTRSPASRRCRSTPSTSCSPTTLGGADGAERDRARARPARLLAVRRARQRAHERLHHRAARRAHGRVGARADRARSGCRRAPFGALVEPGTSSARCSPHHEIDAPVYTRRLARHRVRLRRRAAARRARGDPVLRHLVAARARAAGPGLRRRRRADQRARRRRHDPAAQERHGPVARAGVRARVGRDFPSLQRAAREARGRRPAVRRRRRALPARRRHAGADRRACIGRAATLGPRRDRALDLRLARLQVPRRARAARGRSPAATIDAST